MKILLDTNIVIDVLVKRMPFYESSKSVLDLTNYAEIDEYVSASAVTDIFYITNRHLKDCSATRMLIKNFLKAVHIAAVTENEIMNAMNLPWKDFEDAVQYSVALYGEMDGVVTRNKDDYTQSNIPIWTPQELLEILHIGDM